MTVYIILFGLHKEETLRIPNLRKFFFYFGKLQSSIANKQIYKTSAMK